MRVLVVGAGVAGLSFARALAPSGSRIDIVERASGFSAVGAGIVLQPNGMAAINCLKLSKDVLQSGTIIERMRHSAGAASLILPLPALWEGLAQPTVGIRRSELNRIMSDDLTEKFSNVRYQFGRSVVRMRDPDNPIVEFDDGSSTSFDLVVGADGVKSRIRKCLFPQAQAEATGLQWWRMIARAPASLASGEWISTEVETGSFGIYPIGNGLVHSHVMFRNGQSPCAPGAEATFLAQVASRWDPILAEVIAGRCTPVHVGQPMMVRPATWGNGRCILIGDAAHAIAPTLSEGGSLAMEDGVALATLLQTGGMDELLRRFVALRDGSVNWALRMAASQVNGLRRPPAMSRMVSDNALAIGYMKSMYAPLVDQVKKLSALTQCTFSESLSRQ